MLIYWVFIIIFLHLHMQHAPVTIRLYSSTVQSTHNRISMQNTSKCFKKTSATID